MHRQQEARDWCLPKFCRKLHLGCGPRTSLVCAEVVEDETGSTRGGVAGGDEVDVEIELSGSEDGD